MTLRPAPAVATWVLRFFCSGREHESVVGDLIEQYQQGHGRMWYWRQVLEIVLLSLYGKAVRRPLTPEHRLHVGDAFAVILIAATLSVLFMTPVWPLFLLPIGAGLYIGVLRYQRGPGTSRFPQAEGPGISRIDSSKIPTGSGLATGLVILALAAAVLHDVPPLRFLAVPGLVAGLIFGGVLHTWRKRHPRDMEKEWLSIKAK